MAATNKIIGNRLIILDSVSSTNEYAWQLAAEGIPEGCVVRAQVQTAGKGRLGRRWLSQNELGLWFSVILRPSISASYACLIPFFASIAVRKSIQACFQLMPHVKWPNDLLIDYKKICGILSEARFESQHLDYIILGIGLNLHHRLNDFPPDLQKKAASLAMFAEIPQDTSFFFEHLLKNLNSFYKLIQQHKFALIIELWKSFCTDLGQTIHLNQNNKIVSGVFHDLAEDGALVLKQGEKLVRIVAGDLEYSQANKW